MKFTFLGTSHGVPSATRYCTCTMLETGGYVYFIDAGAPLMDILIRRGTDLTKLRAIFTTHIHGDHTDGLLHFTDLSNWYYRMVSVDIYMTEQRGIEAFTNAVETVEASTLDRKRLRYHLMTPSTVYEDENIRVTPIPTAHMKNIGHPSCGYLIEAEGKKFVFTGDMSGRLEHDDFPKYPMENEVDLVVSEMAHQSFEQIEPSIAKLRTKRLYFTHINHDERFAQAAQASGRYGYPIFCPDDGFEVEI